MESPAFTWTMMIITSGLAVAVVMLVRIWQVLLRLDYHLSSQRQILKQLLDIPNVRGNGRCHNSLSHPPKGKDKSV